MAKILIIDDESNLRETTAELLSFAGFDVFEAQNGKEGLEKVKQIIPNIIICDVMMPTLDGYGFIEAHKQSNYAFIPVVFVTARVGEADQEKGLALGVKAYLKKPFTFKDLKLTIDNHILVDEGSC